MPSPGVADRVRLTGDRVRIPIVLGEFTGTEPLAKPSQAMAAEPSAAIVAARAKTSWIDDEVGGNVARSDSQNH